VKLLALSQSIAIVYYVLNKELNAEEMRSSLQILFNIRDQLNSKGTIRAITDFGFGHINDSLQY
jgi:hypothetical protein